MSNDSDFFFNFNHLISTFTYFLVGSVFTIVILAVFLSFNIRSGVPAAFIEPIFSKYFPALILTSPNLRGFNVNRQWLDQYAIETGVFGGVIFAVIELANDILLLQGSWLVAAISVIIHPIFGGVIGNAVFRLEENRTQVWQKPVIALLLVIAGHNTWNLGLGEVIAKALLF